jgi:malate dehydrogenase (oxaloacetate-decarboxylating)
LAATINALKVVGKELSDLRTVIVGVGAAGVAITKILIEAGAKEILCCDRSGIINRDKLDELNSSKQWVAEHTNPENLSGSLLDATKDADLLIGVSGPGTVPIEAIEQMAEDPIIFALANPVPEIMPEKIQGIARIIATGRSDYPNQINNVLAFPGIFRGALDARATTINEEMKLAAAHAIAECIDEEGLSEEYIVPSVFNKEIVRKVSEEVKNAAHESGVARSPQP